MFLLDTCTVSDFIKGNSGTIDKIKSCAPSSLYVSVITQMEILYGLNRNPEKAKKIKNVMDFFLEAISILSWGSNDAIVAATCRHYLTRLGMPIGPYDLLIAAHALQNNLILVTANDSEFRRVPNLIVENWRTVH